MRRLGWGKNSLQGLEIKKKYFKKFGKNLSNKK
jgi:hypothetical protein